MKNLYTKNEFLSLNNLEILNEGLFGKFWNYLKGIKGGKDIENIYNKYVKIINDEFKQKGKNIQLDYAGNKPVEKPVETPAKPTESTETPAETPAKPTESTETPAKPAVKMQKSSYSFLNEADQQQVNQPDKKEGDSKAEHENLIKIVNLHKNQAQKEMNAILAKFGGAEKSPKLAASINAFMYNFNVALTRAELKQNPNDQNLKNQLNTQEKEYNQKVTEISKGATQDAATIDVAGKKLKLNTPYQYNAGGVSKTIMISGQSKDPQKVIAKYVSDKLGKTIEQPFRANLIKTDFVPTKGTAYKYFSTKRNAIIDVTVESDIDKRGLVKVKTENGNIFVQPGALMNPKKETKPADAKQPADTKQPADAKQPADTKQPADAKQPDAKTAEVQPVETNN